MDPITAVGTLGAVIGIIDVITKTISGLREVGARYKDAEFAVAALVSQLTTLRAALTKIREWMDSAPAESHYQVVMDLGDALSFCGMLADKLESEVLRYTRSTMGVLRARGKLKFAVGGKSIEDLQGVVLNLTVALNLVIGAYTLTSTSEQRAFLESSSSRKVFNVIKDDVSSLYVHRDSASIATKLTDRLSLFSREFAFDRELRLSKVYKDASPRLLEAMRQRTRQKAERDVELQRSRSIDRSLAQGAKAAKMIRVLLLSTTTELGPIFMKALRSYQLLCKLEPLSDLELTSLRPVIRQAAESLMVQAAALARRADAITPALENAVTQLFEESQNSNLLSPRAAESLRRLWEDIGFQRERSRAETDGSGLPSYADYTVENIHRIVGDDYFPTSRDALHAWPCSRAIDETVLKRGPKRRGFSRSMARPNLLTVCSISRYMLQNRKWMQQLGYGAPILVFLVDIAGYGRYLKDPASSKIMAAMRLFEFVANSPMCSDAYPVVWFGDSRLFRSKSELSPAEDLFPGYMGGPDFEKAIESLTSKFRRLYRGYMKFCTRVSELGDDCLAPGLFSFVDEVIMDEFLSVLM